MNYNIHVVNLIIVAGIIQIVFIAIALFCKAANALANRLLATTLIILSLQFLWPMVIDINLDVIHPWTISFPYFYILAVGPLIYLYVKSLINVDFRVTSKELYHFIPLFLEVLGEIVSIILAKYHHILIFKTSFFFFYKPLEQMLGSVSIYLYINKSLKLIDLHEQWVLEQLSNTKNFTLKWLRNLLSQYKIIWLIWIPFIVLLMLFFNLQFNNLYMVVPLYLFLLTATYWTCWIGLEGYKWTDPIIIKESIKHIEGPVEKPHVNKNYASLSSSEIEGYVSLLKDSMEKEKVYMNENLSLKDLSKITNLDSNLISFVLNNHVNKNFFDFVNAYRVEEVKQKMNNTGHQHLTLLGIAIESGFNSKATFNRVFKNLTGLSPKEYMSKERSSNKSHPSFRDDHDAF